MVWHPYVMPETQAQTFRLSAALLPMVRRTFHQSVRHVENH